MLTGRAEATLWDPGLNPAMTAANVAVHEEAIVDLLLADMISRRLCRPALLSPRVAARWSASLH
jgi:hypothetical protein